MNTKPIGNGKEPKFKGGVSHKIKYKHEMKPINTHDY
jgi:hypothetical protein